MTTISRDDYLKALALVVSANDHYRQAAAFDLAMQRLLGMEGKYLGDSKLGDLIYDSERVTVAAFEEALKIDGCEVADGPPGE